MTSKKRYYELKAEGKCTKCAGSLEGSPSSVRCLPCHEKFLETRSSKNKDRLTQGLCIQCGVEPSTGNSKHCFACRQKNAEIKRNFQDKELTVFKENNEFCKVCNSSLDTEGIVCHSCLNNKQFSKFDAVLRYGNKCNQCDNKEVDQLRLVSSDISSPMALYGPKLYKQVCFSTKISDNYKVLCDMCYRTEAINYVKEMNGLLSSKPSQTSFDIDSEIIDL